MTGAPEPPRLLVLTDRLACARHGRSLIDTVAVAVAAGANAFVFREKDLPTDERAVLAGAIRDIVPYLIVASDLDLAAAVGADGVHLAAHDPWPDRSPRPPTRTRGSQRPNGRVLDLGRSCHSVAEVRDAGQAGATYVTLSPIFATESKPGYGPPLGLEALGIGHDVARGTGNVVVYALGGITPAIAAACIDAGSSGVAVMGAIMAAADPGVAARALVDAIASPGHG